MEALIDFPEKLRANDPEPSDEVAGSPCLLSAMPPLFYYVNLRSKNTALLSQADASQKPTTLQRKPKAIIGIVTLFM